MILFFVALVITMILYMGVYLISFNFMGGEFHQISDNFWGSYIVQTQALDVADDVAIYVNNNHGGYTGALDKDDDNYSCINNISQTDMDDDCAFANLYGFVPPKNKLDIGFFEDVMGVGMYYEMTGVDNLGVQIINLNNNQEFSQQLKSGTGYFEYDFGGYDYAIKLNNASDTWAQYYLSLSGADGIQKFSTGYGTIGIEHNFNYYTSNPIWPESKKLLSQSIQKKPVNPYLAQITVGDYNDVPGCAGTGINDIALTWHWTGDNILSGDIYMHIFTGLNLQLEGGNFTGTLNIFCDDQGNCAWTGYDYPTGTYYFQVQSYRCIDTGCTQKEYNVRGSDIISSSLVFCE